MYPQGKTETKIDAEFYYPKMTGRNQNETTLLSLMLGNAYRLESQTWLLVSDPSRRNILLRDSIERRDEDSKENPGVPRKEAALKNENKGPGKPRELAATELREETVYATQNQNTSTGVPFRKFLVTWIEQLHEAEA